MPPSLSASGLNITSKGLEFHLFFAICLKTLSGLEKKHLSLNQRGHKTCVYCNWHRKWHLYYIMQSSTVKWGSSYSVVVKAVSVKSFCYFVQLVYRQKKKVDTLVLNKSLVGFNVPLKSSNHSNSNWYWAKSAESVFIFLLLHHLWVLELPTGLIQVSHFTFTWQSWQQALGTLHTQNAISLAVTRVSWKTWEYRWNLLQAMLQE